MTMDWFGEHTPFVLGHRGVGEGAPENTLAAFALAMEQGADGVELDVQLSADGWPVVCHDFSLDRTTNGAGLVSRLTVAELRALDAGQGEHVPTLDEVFELLGPRALYNLELKDFRFRDRGLEAAVADRIESHGLGGQVLVSSFNPMTVRRARHYLPRGIMVGLIRMKGWWRYMYWFARGEADHPYHALVDEAYMTWAAEQGWRVHVWTVDEPERARQLARLGVHGIISNRPQLIKEALAAESGVQR